MSRPSNRLTRAAKVVAIGGLATLALLQITHWLPLDEHAELARVVILILAAVLIPISTVAAWFLVLTPNGLVKDNPATNVSEREHLTPRAASHPGWQSSTPSASFSQQPPVTPSQPQSSPHYKPSPAEFSSQDRPMASNNPDDVTRPLIDPVNISRWRLLVETGPEAGSQFPLKEPMLAGRAPYADLLLQSNRISREHARFSIENDAPMVTDLASRNGTHVNGRRITAPQVLHEGDEIRLHDVIIRVIQRKVAIDS